MEILNGRYGVYISYQKQNYKIPKTVTNPAELTLEECKAIVADDANASKRSRRTATGATKKSATTTKKSTAAAKKKK